MICTNDVGEITQPRRLRVLCSLLHREPSLHPTLFPFGIVHHVGVAHGRQFTGGVFAGMSMSARAVGDDLGVFVG